MYYNFALGSNAQKTRAFSKLFWRRFKKNLAPIRKNFGACFFRIHAPYSMRFQPIDSNTLSNTLQQTAESQKE